LGYQAFNQINYDMPVNIELIAINCIESIK